MGVIAKADFLVLADSIAAQAQKLATVMGDGSGYLSPLTASDGAWANVERVRANTDSEIVADLIKGFREQFERVTSNPNAYDRYYATVQALNIHVGGMNAYLTAEGERVAPEFKAAVEMNIAEKFDAQNTFSPVVANMGTVEILGAGSGSFSPADKIDNENYYAAHLQIKKITAASGTPDAIVLKVYLKDWDDNDVTKNVSVDGDDALNTVYEIGLGSDKYVEVTDIEVVSGGGSSIAQEFRVQSVLERTVTL